MSRGIVAYQASIIYGIASRFFFFGGLSNVYWGKWHFGVDGIVRGPMARRVPYQAEL